MRGCTYIFIVGATGITGLLLYAGLKALHNACDKIADGLGFTHSEFPHASCLSVRKTAGCTLLRNGAARLDFNSVHEDVK